MSRLQYDIDEFTDSGVLKPGIFMTFVILYASRFLFYGPLSIIASRSGSIGSARSLDISFLTADTPLHMLSSIPAVVFLYLMLARSPKSTPLARKIWHDGKWWLGGSAFIQILLEGYALMGHGQIATISLIQLAAAVYVFYYLGFSQRARDVFSMFPDPLKQPSAEND